METYTNTLENVNANVKCHTDSNPSSGLKWRNSWGQYAVPVWPLDMGMTRYPVWPKVCGQLTIRVSCAFWTPHYRVCLPACSYNSLHFSGKADTIFWSMALEMFVHSATRGLLGWGTGVRWGGSTKAEPSQTLSCWECPLTSYLLYSVFFSCKSGILAQGY